MKNKKQTPQAYPEQSFSKIFTKGILILILGIFLISFASAGISFCCEKTIDGDWCQNTEQAQCDQDFRNLPTSCESTGYCSLGCCYDSQEGTCMENTAEITCNEEGGVYSKTSASCDIPQCTLGCCLIGDEAAFVTQTRCKRLTSLYGVEVNFRTDISNEVQCIMSASMGDEGACVFEQEFETTCDFLTKGECAEIIDAKFYKDKLCSAEELGTVCGPSKKTTCVDGRDEVYFLDTCGNLANIYDSSMEKDKNYWTDVYAKEESCYADSSNADSEGCGNCDYFLGSTCKAYDRGINNAKPDIGDNICRDLACEFNDERYEHGETWCAGTESTSNIDAGALKASVQSNENLPGSKYNRLVCYNGEVSIEPCAEFRQEVCIASEINGFSTAMCRVNRWQECVQQDNEQDCENTDKRDCQWKEAVGNNFCVPLFAPGFNFWESEGEAEAICAAASWECTVYYDTKLFGDKKCVKNCECLEDSAKDEMNTVCSAMGDCGTKTNYVGAPGYHSDEDDDEE